MGEYVVYSFTGTALKRERKRRYTFEALFGVWHLPDTAPVFREASTRRLELHGDDE